MMIPLITKKGLMSLGEILLEARIQRDWSQDRLMAEIREKTGYVLSKSTISALERGHSKPEWNTVSLLVATGYIINPITKNPYTVTEIFLIACGVE